MHENDKKVKEYRNYFDEKFSTSTRFPSKILKQKSYMNKQHYIIKDENNNFHCKRTVKRELSWAKCKMRTSDGKNTDNTALRNRARKTPKE